MRVQALSLLLAVGLPAVAAASGALAVVSSARELITSLASPGDTAHAPPPPPQQRALDAGDTIRGGTCAYRLHEPIADEAPTSLWKHVRSHAGAVVGDASAAAPHSGHHAYRRTGAVGRGSYGEVWRASRIAPDGESLEDEAYVLKRLLPHRPLAQLSGWREVYFNLLPGIHHDPHMARFIEHFTVGSPSPLPPGHDAAAGDAAHPPPELWLVFRDEGVSLSRLLFQQPTEGCPLVEPSAFWERLHVHPAAGRAFIGTLVRQLLLALARLHGASVNVTHRDVKPGNILVATQDGGVRVRLCDFGSGVNGHAATHLYPSPGPTSDEATLAYSPPEVVVPARRSSSGGSEPHDATHPHSYDVFSLGITLVELVLGKPASELFAGATVVSSSSGGGGGGGGGGGSGSGTLLQQRRRSGGSSGGSSGGERGSGDGAAAASGHGGGGARQPPPPPPPPQQHDEGAAAAVAGFARLCIAPAGEEVVVGDAPWMEGEGGSPTSQSEGGLPSWGHGGSSRAAPGGHAAARPHHAAAPRIRCDLEGFRRVWRRAEAWARGRARAGARRRARAARASQPRDQQLSTRAAGHVAAPAAPAARALLAAGDRTWRWGGAVPQEEGLGGTCPAEGLGAALTLPAPTAPHAEAPQLLPAPLPLQQLQQQLQLARISAATATVFGAAAAALPAPPLRVTTASSEFSAALAGGGGGGGGGGACAAVSEEGEESGGGGGGAEEPEPELGGGEEEEEDEGGLLGSKGEALLHALLAWEPAARPTAAQALRAWGW